MFYFWCFLSITMCGLVSAASTSCLRSHYTREALVEARTVWLGQEHRIGSLKYEACEIARTTPLNYVNGCDHVADFDDQKQLVTTYVASADPVCLSYDEFSALIRDVELHESAVAAWKAKQQADQKVKGGFLQKLFKGS